MRFILVGLLAWVGVAAARPQHRARRYVLRDVRIEGNPSEQERKLLEDRIWMTVELMVSQNQDELIHVEEVKAALATRPELKTCFDVRCGAELAQILNGEKVISIGIERSGDAGKGDWMVRVWHFDARAMKVGAAVDLPCNGCDADQLVGDLSHSLAPALALEPGAMCTLKVTSRPEGATVLLEGTVVGATPFQHTLMPGKHAIAVEKKGFSRGEDELECPAGSMQNLSFGLTEGGKVVVHKEDAPRASPVLKIAGSILLIAGAAGVASGGAELFLDGRGTCNLAPGQTQCQDVYDTKLAGGVLVGVGAAALVAGAVVLIVDAVRKPHRN
jgi:hypothetical protein